MREDRKEIGLELEQGEQGFMLVGLIVAIFFILLVLSVAAPKVAQQLRRDREVEAVHRGNQYVRAIRLYYRKTNTYPGSIEMLEKTNNIRFLRQRYIDPMTGKDDWRLIKVGEAKTTVKGFFGQPLTGLAPGLGAAAGQASPGAIGAGAAGTAGSSPSAFGSSSGGSGYGASSSTAGGFGTSSAAPTLGGSSLGGATSATPTLGSGSSTGSSGQSPSNTVGGPSGIGGQSASSFTGGGAPFVGVGVPKEGDSITILNEQTSYNTWEFIYDPRIEQLYAKGALFGGGSTGGLGANSGSASGFGLTPGSSSPTTPGFGTSPGTPGSSSPAPTNTGTPPPQ